jgi:hypothetical protein
MKKKKNFMGKKRLKRLAQPELERRRDAFRKLCQEAFSLQLEGKFDRETFREYLTKGIELVGEDYEILHGLTSMVSRAWYEDFVPRW